MNRRFVVVCVLSLSSLVIRFGTFEQIEASVPADILASTVANFNGVPTSGSPPLQVKFSDESTGSPTGWAWYFGDETFNKPWMEMTLCAEWQERYNHTSVALPNGSIVLMGGDTGSFILGKLNDVWRSTDQGATWTQMTAAAGWQRETGTPAWRCRTATSS
jgi:hypothetical protein